MQQKKRNPIARLWSSLTHPRRSMVKLMERTSSHWSDKHYQQILYRLNIGHWPNLEEPESYTEKMQWIKLYCRRPEFTGMVDKLAVKQYVTDRIGAKYVIPLIGAWDSVDDIDWESLPEQFVLKCTHDSGSVCVCRDKNTFDREAAKAKLRAGLAADYFLHRREWPYKNVPRKVIAEQYVDGLGRLDSIEYKVSCFGGKVKFVTICTGIAHDKPELRHNDHFLVEDGQWKQMDWKMIYTPSGKQYERPAITDEMIRLCETLAAGTPYLRVDWYCLDGQLYFGEMTFFTWSGLEKFEPAEWDKTLGSWIDLPKEKIC